MSVVPCACVAATVAIALQAFTISRSTAWR